MALGDHAPGTAEHTIGVFKRLPDNEAVEVFGAAPGAYQVSFVYRNYRGEVSTRTVVPCYIVWGANDWHPVQQWLLYAIDMEKQAPRFFAMKDITDWKSV